MGGFVACEAHKKYAEDRLTYQDAGVSEQYIFQQMANMIKEQYWEFFGIFTRVSKTAYEKIITQYNAKVKILKEAQGTFEEAQEMIDGTNKAEE